MIEKDNIYLKFKSIRVEAHKQFFFFKRVTDS